MLLAAEPHILLCTVEWGDCDPAGIIDYPTYDHGMGAASRHLLAALGFDAGKPPLGLECARVGRSGL
jgi:acyl-CoA thioesterase FadM